jgi:hypothetical protein
MLHIILPLARVFLLLFVVDVLAKSMRLIIFKVTGVRIAICVLEFTSTICFSVLNVTGIRCAVGPLQGTFSMWNENEMILTIKSSIFIFYGSINCLASRDNFHLARVSSTIWMYFKIIFVNQMLIGQLVNLWITLWCYIGHWTLRILLFDIFILLG